MTASKDSDELIRFTVLFQKLRQLVDGSMDILHDETSDNPILSRLSFDLWRAANALRTKERVVRELFNSPTDPRFVELWRDYERNWEHAVGRIVVREALGIESESGAAPESPLKAHWSTEDQTGVEDSRDVALAFEHAKLDIDASEYSAAYSDDYRRDVANGFAARSSLVEEVGLDLPGIFRRRSLVPFVLIPRHVGKAHGDSEKLSLLSLLREVQEAFVYGMPLAALALMRAILEALLKNHYKSHGEQLNELINNTSDLPKYVSKDGLHRLRERANDILHFNRPSGSPRNVELELIEYLLLLRELIEKAPARAL